MNEYIEKAKIKAGSQTKLAEMLDISDRYIRLVKEGKRSFSDDICIQIADFIEADRLEVIATNNLVTEKDEKKRKIFESCFSRAASFTIAAFFVAVISIMTPSPANASQQPVDIAEQFVLC
jgi:predicted regulator of amino acid metabolism with ACT domain